MENRERICRFCFEKCNTNFEAIDGSTHEILKILLVTMNLAISDEAVMCTKCSEILQKCFVFKKTCLDIRDQAVAFGDDTNNGQAVCEFCMNLLKNYSFTILNIEENISKKTMLNKYFPELDLSASKNLIICEVCHGALTSFFNFVTISSIVEEKIETYCEAEGVNNTDPIKLNNVLKFTSDNVWKENDNKLDAIQMEKDMISVKSENKKMKIQGRVCTLCLGKGDDFKAIDGNTENILDILLPKIDFTVTQGPVMCKNCGEMLIKCFDFIATSLHTHNCIVQFLNNKDDVKLNLKDIYASYNETGTSIPEDQDVCTFCMGLVKNHSAVSISVEEGDVTLKKMIEQCLPELDLGVLEAPVICASCHESLQDCFHFVMKCSIVGEKIMRYCETSDINVNGQIELSSSLHLTIRDVPTKEIDDNSVDIIKVEEQLCEDRKKSHERKIYDEGDTVKLEQISVDDREDAIEGAENKNKSFMEVNDQKVNNEQQYTQQSMLAYAEESDKFGNIKREEIFYGENEIKDKEDMKNQTFLLHEEIEIKTDEHDFNRFEDDIVLSQSEVSRRLHRGEKCSVLNVERDQSNSYIKHTLPKKLEHDLGLFQTRHKNSLISNNLSLEDFKKHLLVHKDRSDRSVYKCDTCSFQTKRKSNLKNHLILHKNSSEVTMYKCDSCLFQTKYKNNLKKHLIVHNNPTEVTMYKCDSCLYQTKYKYSLKNHLLTHKSPSVYKCDSCLYQAKTKHNLKMHLILHKNPLLTVTMYKCNSCSFQTHRKSNLRRHLILHKNPPSEITLYKCDACSFQTKHESYLKDHLLTHKTPLELSVYQTESKCCLKDHLLKHKDPSGRTMYKCGSCLYQTDHRESLKKHLVLHKNPSEITMYKCDYCSFQTKYKASLKKHMLTHKNPSEITMYKCDSCLYETKHKSDLKKHLILHGNSPSEVPMYKCDSCTYQTMYKKNLKNHFLQHKDLSQVTMYKCDYCPLQTKYKGSLKKHMLTHKNSQK